MPKQWKTIASSMLKDSGYPVYGANGIIGYYSEYNHDKETILVTCRGATCGSVNICEPFSYINGNAMALDNLDGKIDIKYLYYYLKKRGFDDVISGSAQPQITRTSIEKIEIPICEISKQKMIVNLFDKTELLINNQKRQLQLLDELVKARFVEMFGDEKKQIIMRDVCSIITDGTHQPPDFKNIGIPFIFVSNIAGDKLTYNVEKYIDQDTYDELIKRTPIEVGDVLLSTVGSYGHAAVVKENKKFLFQRHIAYLKPKSELINSDYLHGAILSPNVQEQIERAIKGIAQKTLNLSEVKKLVIPLPSMEKQNQFASFVKEIDKSRSRIQKSLEASQELFDSLMQEYFG